MIRRMVIWLIHAYRYLLSPWVGNQCRFYPSCSHYGEEAIKRYGVIKGGALLIWRILRCNPWHPGGFDYLPDDYPSDNHLNDCNKEERSTV